MSLEIKCPYCGYDGSDPDIGMKPISMDIHGNPKIVCSKCKQEFPVRLVFRTPLGFVENLIQEDLRRDRNQFFIHDKGWMWSKPDNRSPFYEVLKIHNLEAMKKLKIEGMKKP